VGHVIVDFEVYLNAGSRCRDVGGASLDPKEFHFVTSLLEVEPKKEERRMSVPVPVRQHGRRVVVGERKKALSVLRTKTLY